MKKWIYFLLLTCIVISCTRDESSSHSISKKNSVAITYLSNAWTHYSTTIVKATYSLGGIIQNAHWPWYINSSPTKKISTKEPSIVNAVEAITAPLAFDNIYYVANEITVPEEFKEQIIQASKYLRQFPEMKLVFEVHHPKSATNKLRLRQLRKSLENYQISSKRFNFQYKIVGPKDSILHNTISIRITK
jgi:hypothetical protein